MRVVVLLLAVLALSAFVGCQAKPMVVSESGSESEGIKVHGDWTVEVTNPDGSLATRKQFANEFIGKNVVAGLLSLDIESIERTMKFGIEDSQTYSGNWTDEADCQEKPKTPNFKGYVPAMAVHALNDTGFMRNSVWNASCTLEITGDESKFITLVATRLLSEPYILNVPPNTTNNILSIKYLAEPIEVWDGQVVAATVILSVE